MEHAPGIALITGASSGIGQAFAAQLAAEGHPLVLVARRRERLEELAGRLRDEHGVSVRVLVHDLADPAAPARIVEELAQADVAVEILVNNAGYGVPGAYLSSPWQTHADFLQVMLTAVAELSYRLAAEMKVRGKGRIINVASLAGLVSPVAGGHTLYAAVKAWMIRFSESLAPELKPHGIGVIAVCPGFTYSEFHDVTGMREKVSKLPDYLWQSAEAVAREGLAAARRGDVVYVTGRVNRVVLWLSRHLPKFLFRRMAQRRSRHFRDSR